MSVISCPSCRGALTLPPVYAGKQVRCPSCSNIFTAPNIEVELSRKPQTYDLDAREKYIPEDDDDEWIERRDRYEDEEYERRRKRRRRREAALGATLFPVIMLYLAAVVVIVGGVEAIVGNLVANQQMNVQPTPATVVGMGCGGVFRLLIVGFYIWAAIALRMLQSKGIIITAGVICMVQTLLWIVAGVIVIVVMNTMRQQMPQSLDGWLYFEIAYSFFGAIFHLVTGIAIFMALSNKDLSRSL